MSNDEGKTGRPRKEFSWEQFEKLCGIQCSKAEIAGFFDVSEDTIERRIKETTGDTYAEIYKRLSSSGKITVRRKQFQLVNKEDPNPQMLIWLGKQYLKQSEKNDTISIENPGKLIIDLSGGEKDD